jgi:hypothetical protein
MLLPIIACFALAFVVWGLCFWYFTLRINDILQSSQCIKDQIDFMRKQMSPPQVEDKPHVYVGRKPEIIDPENIKPKAR